MSEPDVESRRPAPRGVVAGLGWRIGTPFGVPVYIAPSWLVFLALITVQFAPYVQRTVEGVGGARYGVSLAFGVFFGLSVLAHEVAHCAVARRFGVPIERIALTVFGGHSAFANEPKTPGQTFWIALVGPVVNVAIAAAALWGYAVATPHTVTWVLAGGVAWTNGLVGLYNLLPGLPLDGGQLLRAIVWKVTSRPRLGVLWGAWAGRVVAALTAMVGVSYFARANATDRFDGLWFMLIAGIMWASASSVLRQQSLRERLPNVSARALTRRALPVTADLPLAEAVRRAQESHARGLIIVDGEGRPTGVVDEAAVNATPANRRPWVSVGSVSRRVDAPEFIPAQLSGEALIKQLQAAPASEYIVVEPGGAIYGVLAAADVAAALRP